MTDPRVSVNSEIKVTEAKVGLYSRIIFGVFCIITGMAAAGFGIYMDHLKEVAGRHEPTLWTLSHVVMAGGMIWAIFGGMILPSVFDAAKPVFLLIFPNGIPMLGGRRSSDPQPPVDPNGSAR